MSLFLLIIIIGALFFYWSINRGKIYVKAYHYIKAYEELISEGKDNFEASLLANGFVEMIFNNNDPYKDNEMIVEAKTYSDVFLGGKQLPVINTARMLGFSK
jgi:hypothetical protein